MLVKKHRKYNSNSGIALVLSILLLASLSIITFIVADIVIRASQTGRQIGQSEIAYLAAETAIEQGLYTIEASRDLTGLAASLADAIEYNFSLVPGSWKQYVVVNTKTPIACVDDNQKITYPAVVDSDLSCVYPSNLDANSDITASNPLIIRLRQDKTFALDLDFDLSSANGYPNKITVDWTPRGPSTLAKLVAISNTGDQTVINLAEYPSNQTMDDVLTNLNETSYRLKLTNYRHPFTTFTLTPEVNAPLPISLSLYAEGNVGSSSDISRRQIAFTRSLWQIYPKPAPTRVTIFYETFPNAATPWNGLNQRESGWQVRQGFNDPDDVRVTDEDVVAGTLPPSGGSHLTFNDCDQGFWNPEQYDMAYAPINLSNYTGVVIEYYWQSDDVDNNEGLRAAYSTDSTNGRDGNWTIIGQHINPTDDRWNSVTYNLPDDAAVSTFMLRFSSRSSDDSENMLVDDIKLTGYRQ